MIHTIIGGIRILYIKARESATMSLSLRYAICECHVYLAIGWLGSNHTHEIPYSFLTEMPNLVPLS